MHPIIAKVTRVLLIPKDREALGAQVSGVRSVSWLPRHPVPVGPLMSAGRKEITQDDCQRQPPKATPHPEGKTAWDRKRCENSPMGPTAPALCSK